MIYRGKHHQYYGISILGSWGRFLSMAQQGLSQREKALPLQSILSSIDTMFYS